MQSPLMNLAGNQPDTSVNGKLKCGMKGMPSVQISLTINESNRQQVFWSWRKSDLANLFNSAPRGTYSVEAWDIYRNEIFLYAEHKVQVI